MEEVKFESGREGEDNNNKNIAVEGILNCENSQSPLCWILSIIRLVDNCNSRVAFFIIYIYIISEECPTKYQPR